MLYEVITDHGLAPVAGLVDGGAEQVDRLLANGALVVWELFAQWVPYVVAEREAILVALDWTDFDADGHSVIALNLVTGHGRATPLVWKTVKKSEFKGRRALYDRITSYNVCYTKLLR